MRLDDLAGDGEAEAGVAAAELARAVEPVERLEHGLPLAVGDAGAVILLKCRAPTNHPLRIALGEWELLLADVAAARGLKAKLKVLLSQT